MPCSCSSQQSPNAGVLRLCNSQNRVSCHNHLPLHLRSQNAIILPKHHSHNPEERHHLSHPRTKRGGGWWEIPWVENMISGWGLLGYTELKAAIIFVVWWVWGRRARKERDERREELVGLRKQQIAEDN